MIYLKPCGKHYGFNGDKCSLCSVSRPVDGVLTTDVCQINNSHGKKKVISKKPECDHIIGFVMTSLGGDGDLACISGADHLGGTICDFQKGLRGLLDEADWTIKFYFCPKKCCAAPIDWEAIEKQINS